MAEGIAVVRDGTYVCMEGPQFSTLAESLTYKNLGYSVIGMTNMPEAKLAREAELCYATVAMVTDFDCWHPDHDAVTVQDIVKVLMANAEKAARLVARLAKDFPREHEPCPIGSDRALDNALITAPKARDPKLVKKLDAVAGRVASAADIDTAMRLGVNYPQGPLAWAGRWGLRTVLATLDELESWYRDGRYRASPLLRRAAATNGELS